MSEAPRICPTCGASLPQRSVGHAHVADAELLPVADLAAPFPSKGQPGKPPSAAYKNPTSVALALIIVALIVVCAGAAIESPGLGTLAAIVATPAIIRTLIVNQRRQGQGNPLSPAGAVGVFLASFAATIGIFILVVVAIVVAFFFICLAAISAAGHYL